MADASQGQENTLARVTFPVAGMTCASCSSRLERQLARLDGVAEAAVSIASNTAEVSFDPQQVNPAALASTVSKTGFSVPDQTLHLRVDGMTCAACSARVERVLAKVPGISTAMVSLSDHTAAITGPDQAINLTEAVTAIEKAGFQAQILDDTFDDAQQAQVDARKYRLESLRVLICGLLTAPFLVQMAAMLGAPVPHLPPLLQLVLAGAVQILAGAVFYVPAWRALRAGAGNMDLLVALGTTAAFALSCYYLISDTGGAHDLYFEASAMVLTLVLFGRWLEGRAKSYVNQGIRGFAALRPDRARVRRDGADGVVELPPQRVTPGDVVEVRAGERLPVDGIIVEGRSDIDQSLITGEAALVSVGPGHEVLAGSLNGDGFLLIRTTRSGNESTVSRLIALVQGAQSAKPAVQKFVDRVSLIFVPSVIGLSLLTLIGWLGVGAEIEEAAINAITVLVIACPCALGLATPTAIMAGTGRAAQRAILIRDANVIEQAQSIDRVVFDKTGTLTLGEPKVVATHIFGEAPEAAVLAIAAGLQVGSTHPLGKALIAAADARRADAATITAIQTEPGRGLMGLDRTGAAVMLGNGALMTEQGVDMGTAADPMRAMEADGLTLVFLARRSGEGAPELLGLFGLSDQPRPEARAVIDRLRRLGLRPVMMTGDREAAAQAQARALGLSADEVWAEVLPADKLNLIKQAQAKGEAVAMVGDGINDAPALAQADLGIAMGSGADVAMETAPVTLMRGDLHLIEDVLRLTQATKRTIWQNLGWAFAYNVMALPLAVFGLLTPVVAGAAMAMSSVSVVGNAARLARWRSPHDTERRRIG